MPRRKILATAALATLAAVALAGCTTSKSGSSDEAKQAAKPSVLQLLANDVKGSLQKTESTTATANTVSFTMKGTAGGKSISGSGAMGFNPVRAQYTMTFPGLGTTQVRLVGMTIYTQLPAAQRAEMHGKSWMKMDLAKFPGFSGKQQFENMDPAKQVKSLLADGTVKAVGEETVNGVATMHYHGDVPMATYLKQVDAKSRATLEKTFTEAGISSIPIDMWVDEQYRPRRAHVAINGSKDEMNSDMTIDYTDFGKPVTVQAPPAKDTLDLSAMMRGLQHS